MKRLILFTFCCAVPIILSAATPQAITYQGRLVEGGSLVNGSRSVQFDLYDASSGGSLLFTETDTVTCSDGLFSTTLGDSDANAFANALAGGEAWLQVSVGGTAMGDRERLIAVPYAVHADSANILQDNSMVGGRIIEDWFTWDDYDEYGNPIAVYTPSPRVLMGSWKNVIGEAHGATVSGGIYNSIGDNSPFTAIGGGNENNIHYAGYAATIGGGENNLISTNSSYTTISGGQVNRIRSDSISASIGGGYLNKIGTNSWYATIPGGYDCEIGDNAYYAFAAGNRAKANHLGTFVWADSTEEDFASSSANQFLIRAAGGVGVGTNVTPEALTVAGNVQADGFIGSGAGLTGIGGGSIAEGSISNVLLADDTVTSAKIADGAVEDADISESAGIQPSKIAGNAATLSGNQNFDSGTLYVDATENEVGIGTTSPASKLDVAGNITLSGGTDRKILLPYESQSLLLGGATSDTNPWMIGMASLHSHRFYVDDSEYARITSTGMGIGTTSPQTRLDVKRSISADATIGNHVAAIENTSTDWSADVLALKVNGVDPGAAANFITFMDAGNSLGSVEGNGSGGVSYNTSGADYAEYLPLAAGVREPEGGEVVGIVDGKVVPDAEQADRFMAVSDQAAVVGNSPGEDTSGYALVCFLGQLPVRVSGPATAGDFIVAGVDGNGFAVAAAGLTESDLGRLIGQALESAPDRGVKRVNTLIGLTETACRFALRNELAKRDALISRLANEASRRDQAIAELSARIQSL